MKRIIGMLVLMLVAWGCSDTGDSEEAGTVTSEQQAAFDARPASERLELLVARAEQSFPSFSYEWTTVENGNTSVVYGDNGLLIGGVDDESARNEIGHAIYLLQQEIDAAGEESG